MKEPEPEDQEPEVEDTKPAQKGEAETEEGFFEVDFDGLKAQNPDVAAWIQIPALEVSYPVVKGTDNEYYLHHMFDGQEHKNGSIFIDYHNQADFTDHNTIIYGHNMKNGSMFGTLSRYQEESLYRVRIFIFMCRDMCWNTRSFPVMREDPAGRLIPTAFLKWQTLRHFWKPSGLIPDTIRAWRPGRQIRS